MAKLNGNTNGHKLSARRQLFVEAYLGKANGIGVEAARLAGYEGDSNSLKVTASRLLTDANVAAAVAGRLTKAKKSMGADQVLGELADIASAPWREFCQVQIKDDDGTEVWDVKMRLQDKLKALELLARHHKLLTDNLVLGGKVQLLDAIRGASDG